MNIKSALIAVPIMISPSAAVAVSMPLVEVRADAHYQATSGPDASLAILFPVATLPVNAEARSYVPKDGSTGFGDGTRVVAYDDADAYAYSNVPGTDGAYARAGGWSPSTSGGVYAYAFTRRFTNWVATGPTATTFVDLFTFFDGFLYTSSNAGLWTDVQAKMMVSITIQSSLGFKQLLKGTGTLNLQNGFTSTFAAANNWSSQAWQNSFSDTTSTMTSTNGHDRLWDQSYSENIDDIVEVPVGEVFGVDYSLTVIADNRVGPYEIFATSDYSHTGDFEMRTHRSGYSVKEVNLVVPEPSTALALTAALTLLVRRRR